LAGAALAAAFGGGFGAGWLFERRFGTPLAFNGAAAAATAQGGFGATSDVVFRINPAPDAVRKEVSRPSIDGCSLNAQRLSIVNVLK